MKKDGKENGETAKRIHSVRHWLDKAERSYADDASAKGELQLLLAKAEMRHLDERRGNERRRTFIRIVIVCACVSVIVCSRWMVNREAETIRQDPEMPVVTRQVEPVASDGPNAISEASHRTEERTVDVEVRELQGSIDTSVVETSDEMSAPVTTVVVSEERMKEAARDGARSLKGF